MSKVGPRIRNRCGWQWVTGSSKTRRNHECYSPIGHTGKHECGRTHDGRACNQSHA